MRRGVLASAYLLDWIAGDPEWLPHPVRLIGQAIDMGERALRDPRRGDTYNLAAGAALTGALVVGSYMLTRRILSETSRRSPVEGSLVEGLLAWTCLASRSLCSEASSVLESLEAGDLPLARRRVARIVGRDTDALDEQGISRAVIETLAESSCDGIVAPLFYLALGGVPLAMAFKTASTLDSMIGHTSERYLYFGRAAARLDDLANYIPARLTALALCAAAALTRGPAQSDAAARLWLRDGDRHKSPNAGQPEAAMAGALGVQLGGASTYGGEVVASPVLGGEYPRPGTRHVGQALQLTVVVSLLAWVAALALMPRQRDLHKKQTRGACA